ncbi:MAG: heme ABC transporter permease CcmC [Pseudomonadota bacterium]
MLSYFANPSKFEAFARKGGPIAFGIFLICTLVATVGGLLLAPEDYQQGDSARILYIHAPTAWLSLSAYTFIAMMSLIAFIWRHPVADVTARAAAAPGAAFTALALLSGAIWGAPTWGAAWVWDARLTSMLLLFFIYIGYIAVWAAATDTARAARIARILALVGFINIPIVKFSVDWWNTLHQPASILRIGGPTIHPSMLWPLLVMMVGFTALLAWFVFVGARADLIAQRNQRAEASAPSRPLDNPTAIIDESPA